MVCRGKIFISRPTSLHPATPNLPSSSTSSSLSFLQRAEKLKTHLAEIEKISPSSLPTKHAAIVENHLFHPLSVEANLLSRGDG
jgi:hypothetical protein